MNNNDIPRILFEKSKKVLYDGSAVNMVEKMVDYNSIINNEKKDTGCTTWKKLIS